MRTVAAAAAAQLRMLALTPMSLVTSYITPLALATVIISVTGRPTAALTIGTAVAAIWNTLLMQAVLVVVQERNWGTIELLVASPAGLVPGLLGRLLGALAQAVVAIPLTLGLIAVAGGVPPLGPWPLLLASFVVIITGLSALALLHMALLIRFYRYIFFLNGIFPMTIVLMGLFVEVDKMPYGIGVLGRVLAPSWAMDAIREASWRPLGIGAGTAAAALVIAIGYASHVRRWLADAPSAFDR